MAQCKRCLFEEPVVTLDQNGICNLCHLHDDLERTSATYDWQKILAKIKKQKGKYHCLIGISGGLDSSILLDWAVKWGLNPLVIHFDNGWNTVEANSNIENIVRYSGVDFIRYHINQIEYDTLCLSFLLAGVSDADIPNDMAMAEMMFRTCKQYGIKYIFNGHNFRTEGSSPLCWSYMDAKYIESVYSLYNGGAKLKNYPLLTFWKQLYYVVICGIKQVRPFYYVVPNIRDEKQELMRKYKWKDYGSKHAENIYTEFIGSYYLPVAFGIDKTITYHSALIRTGQMARYKYLQPTVPAFDENKVNYVLMRLGIKRAIFDEILNQRKKTFKNYKTYHSMFKRWKWLFWILMKFGFLPLTFYKKYTV